MLFKNVYFFQAGIGLLANLFLLVSHIFTIQQVHRPRPIDIVTCHLAFVHIVMLLTALLILSEDMFQLLNVSNVLKCKLVFYMNRVTRNLSISTTCVLSITQVITISPCSFCLSRFKQKLKNYIVIAFFWFWSFNLSSNSNMIIYTVPHSNRTNILHVNMYCSLFTMNSIIIVLFLSLALFQNIFFVGIMLLSSLYMVIFLCNHQRKSGYLHSMRISPAKKATCTVLVLVCLFVIMYCVDIITSSFSTILQKYEPTVLGIHRLVANVYAAVSPLVLISSDKRIIGILQKLIQMIIVLSS